MPVMAWALVAEEDAAGVPLTDAFRGGWVCAAEIRCFALVRNRKGDVRVRGRHEIVHRIFVLVFSVGAALGEPAL